MPPLTTSGARVVDPILTQAARGYTHAERVAQLLFPRVSVPVRGFKRIEFGKEGFRLYNTRRAPGAVTKEIVFGYEGKTADLNQYALDALVPREHVQEAEAGPGIDLQMEAVRVVQDVMSLDEEVTAASLATDPTNYAVGNKETLAGADQWDNAAADTKSQVNDAKEAVRKRIGRDPNVMVITAPQFRALDGNTAILEKTKYTSSDSVTEEILARYWGFEKVAVAKSVYSESDAGDFVDVWGDTAVMAYVPQGAQQSARVPSYGYTYQLAGHPFVEQMAWERTRKSWVAGVTDERSPELVGAEAGYLFSDVLSAA